MKSETKVFKVARDLSSVRDYYRKNHIFLQVVDGYVIAGRHGIVARFTNDEDACKCLTEAGYTRDVTENIIFQP